MLGHEQSGAGRTALGDDATRQFVVQNLCILFWFKDKYNKIGALRVAGRQYYSTLFQAPIGQVFVRSHLCDVHFYGKN